jgi:uncharacterized membrane protein
MTMYFIGSHIIKYITIGIPGNFGDTLINNRLWFYIHIGGGTLVLLLGPLQFWKTFRLKYINLHRTLGKIYIIASLVAIICLVRLIADGACIACKTSQITVTSLWFLSTIAAWWTIKRKNIKAHRQFMSRSYLFAFYFVLVRIIDMLGENIFASVKKDSTWYANTDWLAWTIPLLLLEIYQSWWPVAKTDFRLKKTNSPNK